MKVNYIGEYTKDITPGVDLAPLPFAIAIVIFLISVAKKRES